MWRNSRKTQTWVDSVFGGDVKRRQVLAIPTGHREEQPTYILVAILADRASQGGPMADQRALDLNVRAVSCESKSTAIGEEDVA